MNRVLCRASCLLLPAVLAACGGAPSDSILMVGARHELPADDLPETDLQGRVPLDDQLSLNTQDGRRRGLRAIGQASIGDRGANLGLSWLGDCAYVSTHLAAWDGPVELPIAADSLQGIGVAIVDVRLSRRPALRGLLPSTPATANAGEGLKANAARALLLVTGRSRSLDVFDAANCLEPKLLASVDLPLTAQSLAISPDGLTAYVSSITPGDPTLAMIDLSQPATPQLLGAWGDAPAHGIALSDDARQAYLAGGSNGGLRILDVSAIQERSGAEPRLLGQLDWTGYAHSVLPAELPGGSYVITGDSQGSDGQLFGYSRIIDIGDPARPVEVSRLQLEVNWPENETTVATDLAPYSPHLGGVATGLGVGNEIRTWVFWTWHASGLRVFEITDPSKPGEYAYYNPGVNPATNYRPIDLDAYGLSSGGLTYDLSMSAVRYVQDLEQIWFVSANTGLQIVQFTTTAGLLPD